MRKIVALISLFIFALAVSALAAGTLDEVKKRGVLYAGVYTNNPPFSFYDRNLNALAGHDVDFVSAVAAKLGVRAEFKAVDRYMRLASLIGGDVDLLAASLTRTGSRDSSIDFSDSYLTTGQGFLAKKGTLRSLTDLFGKKVGAVVGTPSESCAKNACEGGAIVPYQDYNQALDALQKGEIAAFSSDQAILLDLLRTLPQDQFEIPDLLISKEESVFGVRQGDDDFAKAVNSAIAELVKSGEAGAIKVKWFSTPKPNAQVAYGAVVRKALTPPRYLAVNLSGIFFPQAEVAVYSMEGVFIGKGNVTYSMGDEFYLDVPEPAYNLVRSGFLITLNLDDDMARAIALRQREVLQSVKRGAELDAARQQADSIKEEADRLRHLQEMEILKTQKNLEIELERERYRNILRLHRDDRF